MSQKSTFVMPHFNNGSAEDIDLTQKVVQSICAQLDDCSRLVIIDDASPSSDALNSLQRLKDANSDSIELLHLPENKGPGTARNLGIKHSADWGSELILFNDSDDIPSPDRLRVTRKLSEASKGEKVIYSGFIPVNNHGNQVKQRFLTGSLIEILNALDEGAVEGEDAWITIGTESGYINLTSTTSVTIETALANPFPSESISEDAHTWFRYSGYGAVFIHDPTIPTQYRVTENNAGSNSRNTSGTQFYVDKCRVDTQGFLEAMALSHMRKPIPLNRQKELLSRFYLKSAVTMNTEGCFELTKNRFELAFDTDVETVNREIQTRPEISHIYHQISGDLSEFCKAA